MRWHTALLAVSLVSATSLNAAAQQTAPMPGTAASGPQGLHIQPNESLNKRGNEKTPVTQGQRVIESVMGKLKDESLAKNALAVLDELLDDTRSAQARIYTAARTINRNLDSVRSTDSATVTSARNLTKRLMAGSYSDALFQSGNLSDHIKTRLSNLVADSLLLQTQDSPLLREDFLSELEIITNRVAASKKFRAGIGAEYMYFPRITYAAAATIDLTPFQTPMPGGNGRTGFVVDFGEQAIAATRIAASGSGLDVAVSIPSQTQTREIITSIRQSAISSTSSSPDLLYRTTLTSKLKPEFDASLSVNLMYGIDWLQGKSEDERGKDRVSYHVGVGTTGYRIDESSLTDIRLRGNPSQTFNELSTTGTTSSTRRVSFNTPYINLEARFVVSDESQLALSYRAYFRNKSLDETQPRVHGSSFSLYFVWLPTFGW